MYTQEQAKQLRKQFWTLFGKRCKAVPELQEKKKKWVLYDTKISGLDLKFDVNRQSASVMIELNHRNENKRLDLYEKLQKYRPLLEDGFENGLEWDFLYVRESGEEVCRIYIEMEGVDIHRQKQWPDIFNFFIENMLKLESNFMDIRDVLKEEL
ncbi:DUF4268 domain-containing protein [Sunxiuqinia indica]|uniref:DUF4268 domain-containing protein n=1 Tax=Sunxiuqinia indica TaxID=2692584 RepID=UPI0013572BDD|nr:DUF4268 domain-containing protein [Sunxiuqinia indica]